MQSRDRLISISTYFTDHIRQNASYSKADSVVSASVTGGRYFAVRLISMKDRLDPHEWV